MKTLHCISGLGADERVFAKLRLPGIALQFVPWADIDRHDAMACYAQKMAAQIPEGDGQAILGLSFGGMLASEIARMRPAQQVIIISSAKSPGELHPPGKFLQFVIHNGLLPVRLASLGGKKVTGRFGAQTEAEHDLVRSILEDTDPHFARCAFRAMLDWRSAAPPPEHIVHIHGTADQLIVPDKIKPTHWVEGGQHIMIYNRAEEVSALIARHLT